MDKDHRIGYTVELQELNHEMLQELLTWVENTWGGVDSGYVVVEPNIVSDVHYGSIPLKGRWVRADNVPEEGKS